MRFTSCLFLTVIVVTSGCWTFDARQIDDTNALLQVVDMLELAIKDRGAEQVLAWEDLKDSYTVTQRGYNQFSFDELRSRIAISFPNLRREGKGGAIVRIVRRVNDKPSQAEDSANKRLTILLKEEESKG